MCKKKSTILNTPGYRIFKMAEGRTNPASDDDIPLEDLEKELEEIQDRIRRARKTKDKKKQVRKQIDAAKNELAAITDADIGSDTDKLGTTTGTRVAFFATLTNETKNMEPDEVIVFDSAPLNLGDGYKKKKGKFKAPVNGIYVISVNLLAKDKKTDATIVKNGHGVASVDCEPWTNVTQTVIVDMKKGDKVFVKVSTYDNIGFYGNNFCTFSGFLLYDQACS